MTDRAFYDIGIVIQKRVVTGRDVQIETVGKFYRLAMININNEESDLSTAENKAEDYTALLNSITRLIKSA